MKVVKWSWAVAAIFPSSLTPTPTPTPLPHTIKPYRAINWYKPSSSSTFSQTGIQELLSLGERPSHHSATVSFWENDRVQEGGGGGGEGEGGGLEIAACFWLWPETKLIHRFRSILSPFVLLSVHFRDRRWWLPWWKCDWRRAWFYGVWAKSGLGRSVGWYCWLDSSEDDLGGSQ